MPCNNRVNCYWSRVYYFGQKTYLCPPPFWDPYLCPIFATFFRDIFALRFSLNYIPNQFCHYFGTNHDYYIKKGNFKLFSFKKWWFLRYLYIYNYKKCPLHAQNEDAGGLISAPNFRRGLFMGGLLAKIYALVTDPMSWTLIWHILSVSEAPRVKIWVFCNIKG